MRLAGQAFRCSSLRKRLIFYSSTITCCNRLKNGQQMLHILEMSRKAAKLYLMFTSKTFLILK
jgi:hypothetical protein